MAKEEPKKKPTHKYQLGNLVISEWSNSGQNGEEYSTYSLEKFYKREGSDKWEYSSAYTIADLVRLHRLLDVFLRKRDDELYKSE